MLHLANDARNPTDELFSPNFLAIFHFIVNDTLGIALGSFFFILLISLKFMAFKLLKKI